MPEIPRKLADIPSERNGPEKLDRSALPSGSAEPGSGGSSETRSRWGTDYDIHPLDRDYSQPVDTTRRQKGSGWTLRRLGQLVFASGCLSLLPAAAIATSFPSTWLESFGSSVHRLGMIAILVGGLIIVTSYRVEEFEKNRPAPQPRPYRSRYRR